MHEVKVGSWLFAGKQARELSGLRLGKLRHCGQGLDKRPEGTMAIELMGSRPQDLNAVSQLGQTCFDQAGLPDPRFALDQHDPPAPRASLLTDSRQELKLTRPTENEVCHRTRS
jgi:hypothetical protein